MKQDEQEKTNEVTYAKKVLNQYKNNYYLAGIEIEPILDFDGSITNINQFIAIKNKTKDPMSCDTPIEKIASIAPRIVSAILEGIHDMEVSYEKKKVLFDVYIKNAQKDLESEISNQTYKKFLKVYNEAII